MVTTDRQSQLRDNVFSQSCTYFGLSTDEKPTGATVANGSCFLELDTGKIYFFDADNSQWREWGA